MPLMTNDSVSERYPQSLMYGGTLLQRITVADLEHIEDVARAGVWYYFPLRAADRLPSLFRIVHREPIDHSPPCDFFRLETGQIGYIQTDDFVYVDESTLALIENYR